MQETTRETTGDCGDQSALVSSVERMEVSEALGAAEVAARQQSAPTHNVYGGASGSGSRFGVQHMLKQKSSGLLMNAYAGLAFKYLYGAWIL